MAISLNDLVRLRGDKGNFARIETLINKRAAAEQAAAAAHADLAKATDALRSLGIEVDDAVGGGGGNRGGSSGGGRGKYGKRRGRPPGSKNNVKAKATSAGTKGGGSVGNARAGTMATKRGPKPGAARRSGEDYVKALDEVGAEFAKAGKTDIAGPDIFAAMRKRGFTSKQVVMNQARAHKGWTMKGVKRGARYFYKG